MPENQTVIYTINKINIQLKLQEYQGKYEIRKDYK